MVQQQVFKNGAQTERWKKRQRANNQNHAREQNGKQS
jgi:hypothetical protein